MPSKKGRQEMESLNALRGIAFLTVMYSHTGINIFAETGKCAVSVFFILSGFVMVYSYYGTNKITEVSVCRNIRFAINKIKRLYLLHVLCTLAMLVFAFIGENRASIKMIFLKLFLNLFFLQEWIPLGNYGISRSINGVSWFLCTTILAYFIFPWIIKKMEKNYNKQKAVFSIVIVFGIILIVGIGGVLFPYCHLLMSRKQSGLMIIFIGCVIVFHWQEFLML